MFKLATTLTLLAAVASTSYATFADLSCNLDGAPTPTADQSICDNAGQGACTLEPRTGDYFCGWAGATCSAPTGTMYDTPENDCDLGTCINGSCRGTFGDACTINADNMGCLGWLYCSPGGTCAGEGALCGDFDGCDTGLECVFASETDLTGVCTETSPIAAAPGASQVQRKRHIAGKNRFDTWA